MRGSLWLILESSRWPSTPGTVRWRWWSGRCGTDCWMSGDGDRFGDSQRERTVAKQLRSKLGDDTDHPAYTFIEPSVGYRMEQGAGARGIVGR